MPAAAVIPAPIAYIKVVAVKKLVVGFLGRMRSVRLMCVYCAAAAILLVNLSGINLSVQWDSDLLL